jgi:hypothetical protein
MANHVPTLFPTLAEFSNFSVYLNSLKELGQSHGIVKVKKHAKFVDFRCDKLSTFRLSHQQDGQVLTSNYKLTF